MFKESNSRAHVHDVPQKHAWGNYGRCSQRLIAAFLLCSASPKHCALSQCVWAQHAHASGPPTMRMRDSTWSMMSWHTHSAHHSAQSLAPPMAHACVHERAAMHQARQAGACTGCRGPCSYAGTVRHMHAHMHRCATSWVCNELGWCLSGVLSLNKSAEFSQPVAARVHASNTQIIFTLFFLLKKVQ